MAWRPHLRQATLLVCVRARSVLSKICEPLARALRKLALSLSWNTYTCLGRWLEAPPDIWG